MSKTAGFRIKRVTLHNIALFSDVELTPGALTLVKGKNGVGKSTIVEAVKAAFGKGHKATLLREGETEGDVVIVLDDGRGAPYRELRMTVTPDSTERKIGYPGEKAVPRPAEELDRMRNPFTLFPTSFLTKSKEERLKQFLAAVPMLVGREDLAVLLSLCDEPHKIDLNKHAFVVLEQIDKMLFTQRAALNAVVNANRKTLATMRDSLPESAFDPEIATRQLAAAKDEMEGLLRREHTAERDILKQQVAFVESAKAEYAKAVELAASIRDQAIDTAHAAMNQSLKKMRAEMAAEHQNVSTALATAEANHSGYIRAEEARKHMETLANEAETKDKKSKRLTEALDVELAELRSALLEKVPIAGVAVKDDDIVVTTPEGKQVPFDAVNTAEKIRILVDLALLSAGPLKLICLDGAEALDQEHLDSLRTLLVKRGAQCIASQVTDDPALDVVS